MIFKIRHKRTNLGYFFSTWLISLVRINAQYVMQLKIPAFDFTWTFYKSEDKPRFRNLPIISFLLFPCVVFFCILIPILQFTLYAIYYFGGIWLYLLESPNHFDLAEKISSAIWFILGVIGLFYLFNL